VDEHLRGHAADVRAGAPVHLFRLFHEDDALAGVGQRVCGGLAALAEADDQDIGGQFSYVFYTILSLLMLRIT